MGQFVPKSAGDKTTRPVQELPVTIKQRSAHRRLYVMPTSKEEKVMLRKLSTAIALSFVAIVFGAVISSAQSRIQYPGEGKYTGASLWVTATAGTDHILFASLGIGKRMRLEILSQTGDRVFDSEFRDGNLLDWQMDDSQGNRLPDDVYGCLVTAEDTTGQLSHRRGVFRINGGVARFETLQRGNPETAASFEAQDSIAILSDDGELPTVQLLHDGESGQLVSGKGGLSFRIGNGLAGKDVEHMHLTDGGDLGIGIKEPLAKLDVAGLIRAQGIMFSDGTIQRTAPGGGIVALVGGASTPSPDGAISVSSGTGRRALTASGSAGVTGAGVGVQSSSGSAGQVLYNEGPSNTLFGQGAGISITDGESNAFFGVDTGHDNLSGSYNSFFGREAGRTNSSGISNAFFGSRAGRSNNGSGNSFFGSDAGFSNTIGSENAFFGNGAGDLNIAGSYNSFFGSFTGVSNRIGEGNSFFGYSAGRNNTGGENSFFGREAGFFNTLGNSNSFFGTYAGHENHEASYNSFFGWGAGFANTSGMNNSFFGYAAGGRNNGNDNSFFGWDAGYSNTLGSSNSFIGKQAGYRNLDGASNSFFGAGAGSSNSTEDNNTFIGANSDGAAGVENATAIGFRAKVMKSNSLILGSINGVNAATADTNVGIGTTTPLARLHVQNGDVYVGSGGQGIILKSPNGTKCAKLSLDNSGTLVTTSQACPVDSSAQAQVLYAAQFANGDGVISEVILCNPSTTEAVSGRASFYDNAGLPMTVGISGSSARSSMDFSLPPLGTYTFSTDGLGNLNSGSMRVSSDGSVAGFVRFNLPGIGVAGVGSSQPLSEFIAPVRGKLGSIYSGIAIQNIENSPVTVDLSLRDPSGTIIPNGRATVPQLAALGHFALFVHQLFPQATLDDFEGSLTVEVSGGRITATALELGSTAGQFTTLPVAPLR